MPLAAMAAGRALVLAMTAPACDTRRDISAIIRLCSLCIDSMPLGHLMGMRGDWGPVQKEAPASRRWIYRCGARALGLSGMWHTSAHHYNLHLHLHLRLRLTIAGTRLKCEPHTTSELLALGCTGAASRTPPRLSATVGVPRVDTVARVAEHPATYQLMSVVSPRPTSRSRHLHPLR